MVGSVLEKNKVPESAKAAEKEKEPVVQVTSNDHK